MILHCTVCCSESLLALIGQTNDVVDLINDALDPPVLHMQVDVEQLLTI